MKKRSAFLTRKWCKHVLLNLFLLIVCFTLSNSEVASISGSVDDTIDEEFN